MEFSFDKTAHAIYFKLKDGIVARTVAEKDDTYVDLDQNGQVLGYEVLNCIDQSQTAHEIPSIDSESILV